MVWSLVRADLGKLSNDIPVKIAILRKVSRENSSSVLAPGSSCHRFRVLMLAWSRGPTLSLPTNPEHGGDSTRDHFRDEAGHWPMSACLRVSASAAEFSAPDFDQNMPDNIENFVIKM